MQRTGTNNDDDILGCGVPEDAARLCTLERSDRGCDAEYISAALRRDQVVLVRNALPQDAEDMVVCLAEHFGLQKQLQIHAAFATIHGHRFSMGRSFVSVNKRDAFQFIPPHSEGQPSADVQLAFFYCYENSTDGGETILLNIDDDSVAWESLRAVVQKIDLCGMKLSSLEIARAKSIHQVRIPEDLLNEQDEVLRERESPLPGTRVFDVLVKLRRSYSRILERESHVYWDNVASYDFDSGKEYLQLLQRCGLLRQPADIVDFGQLDNAHGRRLWSSGIRYHTLFRSRIVAKLARGDLIIQNNFTWAHSAANWTPGSGNRKVVAAFC